jgi:lipoprotein-releasing system permease protein
MIRQPYTLSIALRYLRARRQSAFISFISAVSMLGVALAVGLLIIVMAVVNGFETELERRILSVSPDAQVYGHADGAPASLEDWNALNAVALERDDIRAAAPFVEGQGLLRVGERLQAVTVRGVDLALEPGVSTIGEHFVAGSLNSLAVPDANGGRWNIAVGSRLAEEAGIAVGDRVRIHTPSVRVTMAGPWNTNRVFTVTGIFDVGLAEYDRGLVLVGLDQAAALYRTRGKASGLSLRVADVYQAPTIVHDFANDAASRVRQTLSYEDWSRRHGNVFRSIELTKPLLFIVLSLVIAIAAFNIVSTLFMVVREKRGDIAILRSIGSAPRDILRIFIAQGSSIGLIGVAGGLALGLALVASLGTIVGWVEAAFGIDVLSADVYLVDELLTEARPGEIAGICALAFGLAVLATLFPAWRASRLPPAEALRNE